ncbi:MAG TPA: hypothetical protein VN018_02350 [Brevundimonas sp.]|nr:hypothetical protein [Brevundimonas sp.]
MTNPVRPQPRDLEKVLLQELADAEAKAWDSLARYKFFMFGYWAAAWVRLNRMGDFGRPNPWGDLVGLARARRTVPEAPGETVAA